MYEMCIIVKACLPLPHRNNEQLASAKNPFTDEITLSLLIHLRITFLHIFYIYDNLESFSLDNRKPKILFFLGKKFPPKNLKIELLHLLLAAAAAAAATRYLLQILFNSILAPRRKCKFSLSHLKRRRRRRDCPRFHFRFQYSPAGRLRRSDDLKCKFSFRFCRQNFRKINSSPISILLRSKFNVI